MPALRPGDPIGGSKSARFVTERGPKLTKKKHTKVAIAMIYGIPQNARQTKTKNSPSQNVEYRPSGSTGDWSLCVHHLLILPRLGLGRTVHAGAALAKDLAGRH
jgi:hypothetical protein